MGGRHDNSAAPPLLEMRGIVKSFPGVRALRGVDLTLRAGEVLALLGENGAGKSTLIKTLGGAYPPDEGTIRIDGGEARISNPVESRRLGVGIIYQEFNLVPAMTAAQNLFLGREPGRLGFVNQREERRRAQALFDRIGVKVDPDSLCRDLSVAQQQVVEIAKALSQDARIIVMDEPSASLTPAEVAKLFTIIRELQGRGIGVIYISHRLDEVYAIADRATVLRDGATIGTRAMGQVSRGELIRMMVGREVAQEFPKVRAALGAARLVVRGLHRGAKVRGVSLTVHRGEVLGITGLVGAGRTETARLIFGADRRESGTIELDGRTLRIESPRDAIAAGICLLTEDRKGQGLVLGQSIRANFGLANLKRFSRAGFMLEEERTRFAHHIEALRIKTPGGEQLARNLSGGNQQKVVLAKWLERDARVIIFDEPTRGIDVGAKAEIYELINGLAAAGKAVIMISSELPEVLGMSDRVLVMHEGRITGEVTDMAGATQEQVLAMAVR
jgi:ABC-type sugar transport system ATPase subunit